MFSELLEKVVRDEDLTADEAAGAMREVMEGRAPAASLAALLSALVMKGERPAEIVGFARTMREHSVKLMASPGEVFDTAGTGGDRSGTFNISSAAAVVIPGAGVKVAKHGNRSVPSRCGRADVPSVDEACGPDAPGTRHSYGLQPAWTAHEPGGSPAADRRRPAV